MAWVLAWVQEGGALRSRKASGPKRPKGLPAAAWGADMRHAPPPSSPHLVAQPWQNAIRGQRGRAGVWAVEGEVPTDPRARDPVRTAPAFAPREMRGGRSRVLPVWTARGRVCCSVGLEQGPHRPGAQR